MATKAAPNLLVLAATLLLIGDVFQLATQGMAWTVFLALAFTAFAAGLLLLPGSLYTPSNRIIQTGAALAFIGSVAGASMQAMFRAWEVLEHASAPEALKTLQDNSGITLTTLAPGILFPIGLCILAIGLRTLRITSVALALGAILFPVGHAAGHPIALIGGDIVLLAAFILLRRSWSNSATL